MRVLRVAIVPGCDLLKLMAIADGKIIGRGFIVGKVDERSRRENPSRVQ
jgi:hypothetical protein